MKVFISYITASWSKRPTINVLSCFVNCSNTSEKVEYNRPVPYLPRMCSEQASAVFSALKVILLLLTMLHNMKVFMKRKNWEAEQAFLLLMVHQKVTFVTTSALLWRHQAMLLASSIQASVSKAQFLQIFLTVGMVNSVHTIMKSIFVEQFHSFIATVLSISLCVQACLFVIYLKS